MALCLSCARCLDITSLSSLALNSPVTASVRETDIFGSLGTSFGRETFLMSSEAFETNCSALSTDATS